MFKSISNTGFQGRFIFSGTNEQSEKFVKFMEKEVEQVVGKDFVQFEFQSRKYKNSTVVLTGSDTDRFRSIKDLAQNTFIKAEIFYDAAKNALKPNVIGFEPFDDEITQLVPNKIKEDITGYLHKKHYYKSVKKKWIPKFVFNKPISLENAVNHINNLFKRTVWNDEYRLESLNKALKLDKKLKNIKITEILGAGYSSIVFKTSDNKALKLSILPCYPKKIEPFDLPIFDKGFVKIKNEIIYYNISPIGKNIYDTKINPEICQKLKDKIIELKYKTTIDFEEDQVVIVDGKPYVCDYDCIEHKDKESRMFDAQKSSK